LKALRFLKGDYNPFGVHCENVELMMPDSQPVSLDKDEGKGIFTKIRFKSQRLTELAQELKKIGETLRRKCQRAKNQAEKGS
jgi:hypothetical protein